MLEVTGLTKDYPTPRGRVSVLRGVSLSLERGDAASIMGPSGSGKSTLLAILGALEAPTAGMVTLDGRNPFELSEPELAALRNRHIGFIFQDHCLLPQCTVLENVLVPTLVGAADPQAESRARNLLDQVGLSDRLDHLPSQLSGGEKQRVAIARALIREPLLLLCDEPTGNLDHDTAETVAELLVELHRRSRTILVVVTHSPALAARTGKRFALDSGLLRRIPG